MHIQDDHDGEDEGKTLALFNVAMEKFDISIGNYDLKQKDMMDASKDCSVNNVMELFESCVQLAMETLKKSIEWEDCIRGTTVEKDRADDEIGVVMGQFEKHLINLE